MANQKPLTEEVYVTFSAEINPNTCQSLIGVMSRCANEAVKRVHLLLSTPGGQVMSGINLFSLLKAMPFELVMYNTGSVNSVGNTIFLAGSPRYAVPHATFMFHGVGTTAKEGMRLDEKDLNEKLAAILTDQKKIGAIITEHTSLTDEQVAGLFLQAQTKDTDFAIECGIIDEVKDVKIPNGSTVLSLVFQRQGA